MNGIKELENTVLIVYEAVDKEHQVYLEKIKGGCHCCPATEWLGDICIAFRKLLAENAIHDIRLEKEVASIVSELSKTFQV